MNKDIRLSVNFFDHPKTIKLQRKLGQEGVISLLRLWVFAANHKCTGSLVGMDAEEIAIAAKWGNDPLTFVTTLVEIRWLDVDGDVYSLHDWNQHQSHLRRFSYSKRLCSKTWKKVKEYVFKRDNGVCHYCGIVPIHKECDHIIPLSRGGNNFLSNLTTSCPTCNRKKGTKTEEEWAR